MEKFPPLSELEIETYKEAIAVVYYNYGPFEASPSDISKLLEHKPVSLRDVETFVIATSVGEELTKNNDIAKQVFAKVKPSLLETEERLKQEIKRQNKMKNESKSLAFMETQLRNSNLSLIISVCAVIVSIISIIISLTK